MIFPLGFIGQLPNEGGKPLFIIAGSDTLSLVNLDDGHMESLIEADNTVYFHQQAFFIKEEEHGGLSIHFTVKRTINETNVRYNWVRMPFKPDCMEILQRYSCLPITRYEDALELKLENEKLKQENEELRRKLLNQQN